MEWAMLKVSLYTVCILSDKFGITLHPSLF